MKTVKTVEAELYKIFEQFETGEITSIEMCDKLEKLLKGKGKLSYWFRFFNGDTLANDANSVRNSTKTAQNWMHLRECIQLALSEREIQVFYS